MGENSKVNKTSSEVAAEAGNRAARRKVVNTEATAASTGDSGQAQGDRAKRAVEKGE